MGQANFTSGTANRGTGTAANTMNAPISVSIDGSNGLYVSGVLNHRILIFNSDSGKADGDPADNVLGQSGFGTSSSGTTASTLNSPYLGWFDSNKGRWVADQLNHRTLSYLDTDLIVSTTSTPTMPEWVMIIFMLLTGMMAVYKLKRIKISN